MNEDGWLASMIFGAVVGVVIGALGCQSVKNADAQLARKEFCQLSLRQASATDSLTVLCAHPGWCRLTERAE